jgi:ABC-type sugar transport system ATPase subunit
VRFGEAPRAGALDQDSTEMLFERIRGVVKTGTSVIYITA